MMNDEAFLNLDSLGNHCQILSSMYILLLSFSFKYYIWFTYSSLTPSSGPPPFHKTKKSDENKIFTWLLVLVQCLDFI